MNILEGKLKEAEERAITSRAKATANDDKDLVPYVRNTLGCLYRARKSSDFLLKARREYEAALETARDLGIRRLMADIYSELGQLDLQQGNNEGARINAMKSVAIANELSLGLKQCNGLLVLGLANVKTGLIELGRSYLNAAKEFADSSGYLLKAVEAGNALKELGSDFSIP